MTEANKAVREVRAIEIRGARVWLGDDGIVRHDIESDETIDLERAKATIAAITEVSGGQKRPVRVRMNRRGGLSSEGRGVFDSEETAEVIVAVALVQTSRVAAMVANLFLKLKKTRYPMQLFLDEGEALRWLKESLPR
jgi:hypothetical protein